jgi:ribosome-associated toxin RatA of RatAB toxin-antitoxin module
MPAVERSALLRFRAADMHQLVADIEAYPEFLPGCVSARIEQADAEWVRARLGFRVKGLSDSFSTENRNEPLPDGASRIHMRLLDGPFRQLSGVWEFQPLADDACKVSLSLSLDFGNRLLESTLGPMIDRAVRGVMDAFRQRAETIYVRS